MLDEMEARKKGLYREWWRKRDQPTINNPKITYSQRFAEMHGQTLESYHARLRDEASKG